MVLPSIPLLSQTGAIIAQFSKYPGPVLLLSPVTNLKMLSLVQPLKHLTKMGKELEYLMKRKKRVAILLTMRSEQNNAPTH
jgi:hypothetical protein